MTNRKFFPDHQYQEQDLRNDRIALLNFLAEQASNAWNSMELPYERSEALEKSLTTFLKKILLHLSDDSIEPTSSQSTWQEIREYIALGLRDESWYKERENDHSQASPRLNNYSSEWDIKPDYWLEKEMIRKSFDSATMASDKSALCEFLKTTIQLLESNNYKLINTQWRNTDIYMFLDALIGTVELRDRYLDRAKTPWSFLHNLILSGLVY